MPMNALRVSCPALRYTPSKDKLKSSNDSPWMECCRVQDIYTTKSLQSDGSPRSTELFQTGQDELQRIRSGWNTLTVEEALAALEDGLLPNPSVEHIASVLRKCTEERNPDCTVRLHDIISRHGLLSHPSVGSPLIMTLVNCGCVQLAEQFFDKLKTWDDASLKTLITTIIKSGALHAALHLYDKLNNADRLDFEPHIYVKLLKVCAEFKYLEQGCKLHVHIRIKGLLKSDQVVGNTLVSMYTKCNELSKAQDVFNELALRNVVSWNALIAGYARQGRGVEALACYKKMQGEGISPSVVTFICVLNACCSTGDVNKGQEVHAEIARQGMLQSEGQLCNALLDMYAKCGCIAKAHEVFNSMENRDVISWNTLISGYTEHGHGIEALECIDQMRVGGVSPDAFTYACSLKACGIAQAIDRGLEIHAKVLRSGLLERDYMIASALVDMYAKCGLLMKAQDAFDNLPFWDVISWTSLIAGYAEHGPCEKALSCFDEMRGQGLFPNAVTFLCSLKACGSLGAITKGSEIHALIAKKGLLERDLLVGSTLVDMYAKCGSLHKAEEVFDKLSARDVVSWNALLAGYSQAGETEGVFLCYDNMQKEGTKPNVVTFTILLNACNHLGLVDKGLGYCEEMSKDFAIIPNADHLACMVDLLGRSGLMEKVVATINKMPTIPDRVVWITVLSACQKWKNVEVGRWAFEQALQLDRKDPSAFVCMGIIYAEAGMKEDAIKVEALRIENQAWHTDIEYCSWMDVTGFVHKFTLGNRHALNRDVHAKLEDLSNQVNNKLGICGAPQAPMDPMIPDPFCAHNERFAVSFALFHTLRGTPIHIQKNVRICNNCHVSLALLSEIEQRKIVVEDNHHHHVFLKGFCSCKDYW